jgi:hypothetical protein
MRASSSSQERRDRLKNTNTVASRMKQVVDRLIDSQQPQPRCPTADHHPPALPRLTMFLYRSQQAEAANNFLVEMQKENPSFFHDGHRDAFMHFVRDCYDEFRVSCDRRLHMQQQDERGVMGAVSSKRPPPSSSLKRKQPSGSSGGMAQGMDDDDDDDDAKSANVICPVVAQRANPLVPSSGVSTDEL